MITVETSVFINGKWTCPTCKASCDHDQASTQGQPVYRCRKCKQELVKTGDTWQTSKAIVRDPAARGQELFKEVPLDETFRPVPVRVIETPRTESWSWQCPVCRSQNAVGLGMDIIGPAEEYRDNNGMLYGGKFLKCWSCLVVLQETAAGTWEIFSEAGR